MLTRLFHVAAIVAIVNLLALAGMAGYAYAQGWLAKDRVTEAVAVLKGDAGADDDAAGGEVAQAELPKKSIERIERNEQLAERQVIELGRREREISDAAKLLETQVLSFLREKEQFQAAQDRWEQEQEARAQEADNSGLQKELEILSGLKAKDAKELLRQKNEEDVVRILMQLDERQARKIVSACKSKEDRLWIGQILEKLHESDAIQAEALDAGE